MSFAVVQSLPEAMKMVKRMEQEGWAWSKGMYGAGRQAMKEALEAAMTDRVSRHLVEWEAEEGAEPDRRNGTYRRHLLTALGDIELEVPRTRRFNPVSILRSYARRERNVDRLILGCFVLGLSTRKVARALFPILGEPVSATTVSRVARALDEAVAAFHRRRLQDRYRVLVLDGVVLSRKTGAGAMKRPVLVALGILPDGRKEVIDFRLARSESEAEWTTFLTDLERRGLTGEAWELIAVDGGSGLLAALSVVFPNVPVQRCWAHKMRNILDKVRKADQKRVKAGLQDVYRAENLIQARKAAGQWARQWQTLYPKAVQCLRNDLEELLTFYRFPDPEWRQWTRTTNAIERRFREVRRRTRPMGVFQDRTSMDRILYALFTHENTQQGVTTPFLVTQNS